MATRPGVRIVSARRSGGEYEARELDRWYQSIAGDVNNGVTWYSITGNSDEPITGDYTLKTDDSIVLVDASAGTVTITLPTAVGILGRRYDIKKIDSSGNSVVVQPDGTETVDGCNPISILFQYDNMTVVSDGSNWVII